MGLSQNQLAEKLGTTQSRISKYESSGQLNLAKLILYCKALGTDPLEIVKRVQQFLEQENTKVKF